MDRSVFRTRREWLASVSGVAAVGLGGCLRFESDDGDGGADEGTGGSSNGSASGEGAEPPGETETNQVGPVEGDWPMAFANAGNASATETAVSGGPPSPDWGVGGPLYRIALADGTVFGSGLDGHVYAIDADDGAERWRTWLGGPVRTRAAAGDGVVGVSLDDGTVVALDAESGEELWRDLEGGISRAGVAIADGVLVGSDHSNIYGFDPESGDQLWVYESEGRVASTPATGSGRAYVSISGGTDSMTALDLETGEEDWIRLYGDHHSTTGRTPAVDGRHLVVAAELPDTDGIIHGLDTLTGDVVWSWSGDIEYQIGDPVIIDGIAYFVNQYDVAAFEVSTGENRFQTRPNGNPITRAADGPDGISVGGTGGTVEVIGGSGDARGGLADLPATIYDLASDGETIFAATAGGAIRALDGSNGDEHWVFDRPGRPVSQVAVAGDGVYVPTIEGAVSRVDPDVGEIQWTVESEGALFTTPAIAGNVAVVSDTQGTVYGLDVESGEQAWTASVEGTDLAVPNWSNPVEGMAVSSGNHYWWPSPTVADGFAYVAEGEVAAIDIENGTVAWTYGAVDDDDEPFASTPAVADGLVYVAQQETRVVALDAEDGSVKWEFEEEVKTSPVLDGDTAYVGSARGGTIALDAAEGSQRWITDVGSGRPLALGSDRLLVTERDLYALSPDDGEELWSADVQGNLAISPVVAGDTVLIGTDRPALHAYDLESGSQQWEIQYGQSAVQPVVAESGLFVAAEAGLYCFDRS